MHREAGEEAIVHSFLVLGIGNVLWADEGFGVRAVEAFHRLFQTSDDVLVMDGGTQGLYLVQHVQKIEGLIVFDAVDYGLAPGTMKLVIDDEVPKFMGVKKMSLHQTGFQEVLAAAELLGGGPSKILLVGVQPVELDDWGGPLRELVAEQIEPAIEVAAAQLARWGAMVIRRERPLEAETGLLGHGLDHLGYERRGGG